MALPLLANKTPGSALSPLAYLSNCWKKIQRLQRNNWMQEMSWTYFIMFYLIFMWSFETEQLKPFWWLTSEFLSLSFHSSCLMIHTNSASESSHLRNVTAKQSSYYQYHVLSFLGISWLHKKSLEKPLGTVAKHCSHTGFIALCGCVPSRRPWSDTELYAAVLLKLNGKTKHTLYTLYSHYTSSRLPDIRAATCTSAIFSMATTMSNH